MLSRRDVVRIVVGGNNSVINRIIPWEDPVRTFISITWR